VDLPADFAIVCRRIERIDRMDTAEPFFELDQNVSNVVAIA